MFIIPGLATFYCANLKDQLYLCQDGVSFNIYMKRLLRIVGSQDWYFSPLPLLHVHLQEVCLDLFKYINNYLWRR